MTQAFAHLPHQLLAPVIELARRAGEVILPYWRANVSVVTKTDASPVTAADIAAHHLLVAGLQALAPDIHVLSEEDADIPLSERSTWERWWLVDPLDGTKEFISGSEEFTVNIALIEQGRVVFGVVSMPTNNRCYFGGAGLGAWRSDDEAHAAPIRVRTAPAPGEAFTVVASRRHTSPEQERLLEGLSESLGDLQLTSVGSSLKFCLLAEGAADCYPRLAPTSQWDTAAAQGVLEGAGGEVLDLAGETFSYPSRESLLNTSFLALPANAPWRSKLLALAKSEL
ncbi:3'(2'),5'-bisphosphate nucleotidase CysQ [Pseudomonas sp. RTC3]|uniref:3'(2'),5'-bisphosphate nucleotidase CysQ n=1 Tax=Pseudomonas sp. 5C2 TaxID=3048588 RepID=UPI002AB44349|nr:3'(2'),5'-bisphosphate nucleotidase CysQ [Pseudomonas sp. 5C2]MDY7567452.1 3'(2'),5'-bisphosphate nucleotidase CysQ [Pseudomonas sp. 5C2]MEB0064307.1 3'(2'),5'-bisphosphate nucleotidase CysQ [Pseudomonas sp. RTC3]MEB0242802.1 3'(2'),5'-bisphosphate nucleotidase CysQ [Pseudomonas sp. 5C2]